MTSVTPLIRILQCILIASLSASCTHIEDKRLRQLLVEKGFGTRAEGNATLENYVGGGDLVGFVIDPTTYLQPGAEQLYFLAQPQPVGIDGTIMIPYVGQVQVLGLTERELTDLVREQLQPTFTFPIQLQARIVTRQSKAYYVFGEGGPRYNPIIKADLTFFEAMVRTQISQLANLGRVHLIRPDAQDPLVIVINFREMVMTGNTTYNIPIQENDIIYIPPTFFGHITRFFEKLLSPIAVIVRALWGVAQLGATYDYLFLDQPLLFGRGGGVRF